MRVAVNEAFAWPDSEPSDEWTPRRLWALVQGLPPEAAVWRDLPQSWTERDQCLAVIAESLTQGQYVARRPGQGQSAKGNVVSIADFVANQSKHMRG